MVDIKQFLYAQSKCFSEIAKRYNKLKMNLLVVTAQDWVCVIQDKNRNYIYQK